MYYICRSNQYKRYMESIKIGYLLITFGYVIIFSILGAVTLLLQIPSEKGMESYKKARRTLGGSLTVLAVYCLIRLIFPQHHADYQDFWLLVTFTLIHAWLTYSSLLFLLETPRYILRRFIIDGAIPASLMLISGFIGIFIPSTQPLMQIIFGCIFGMKCTYMYYICIKEYRKCETELVEYYDETPDIQWIKNLMHLSLFMSAATLVSFYVDSIHLIYYLSIPVIYVYIVFRIVNFAPKKIDNVRQRNAKQDKPEEKKKKPSGIDEKIGESVNQWISEKKFCTSELNIKDVATDIGTNHSYLSQYLNNHIGMTFQVWLNTLRIEESKILLTNGEKQSIEQIGLAVGFSQLYNFSRWFKIVTGTTPFQYRKQNSKV